MSTKIEAAESSTPVQSEFSPPFVRWLVILTIATLLMVAGHRIIIGHVSAFTKGEDGLSVRNIFAPWVIAGRITISSAVEEFTTGEPIRELPLSLRLLPLAALVLTYVVGPTLFLLRWRAYSQTVQIGMEKWSAIFRRSGIPMLIGGVMTSVLVLGSVPIAAFQYNVYQNIKRTQMIAANRDALLTDVNQATLEARQHFYLSPPPRVILDRSPSGLATVQRRR